MSSASLRDRLLEDLRSGSLPVIVTAVVLALPAAYAVTALTHTTSAGFLTLMTVGVVLPTAHETHWPTSGGWRDVAWTVAATLVAVLAFLAVYVGTRALLPAIGRDGAAITAFLLVNVGGLAISARIGPG
ncbi:MAG: hypothetical protein ABEJ57_01080 [Halobacteriaceae archaeon]